MRELFGSIVVIGVIMGIVYVAQGWHERNAAQPAIATQPEQATATPNAAAPVVPLKCAIVVSSAGRKEGQSIAGMNIGLLTPTGEMLAAELSVAARRLFQEVEVVDTAEQARDADVILKPGFWIFENPTGFNLTGLALIYATGSAFVSGHVKVHVRLRDGTEFPVTGAVEKATIECSGVVPIAKQRKIMTDATRHAIAVAAEQLYATLAEDARVCARSDKKSN